MTQLKHKSQNIDSLSFFCSPFFYKVINFFFAAIISYDGASQVVLVIKNLPASAGDVKVLVPSLVQEKPPKEGMATHSSILAQRNPMDRGAWQAIVHRATKSQKRLKQLSMHTCSIIGYWPLSFLWGLNEVGCGG